MEKAAGLSLAIADHVANLPFSALSEATVHATKRALLDGIGVMLAASGASPEVAPFVAQARAGGAGPADVLGTGIRATPMLAALANGAMAHALDFEDAFDAAPSHPNAALIPALLATAQELGTVSGRDLIVAMAIGCDLVCRLGLALRRPMEAGGWYPPPILGAFGAAAAAARLRGLSPEQVLNAFSLMMCQSGCPGEIKYSRDTVIRAVREAFPAQAAVQATVLAAAGVRGFEAPFEGEAGFFRLYALGEYAPDDVLDRLGEHFWIEQLSFKQWPACRGTHPYIEAAQALRTRHDLLGDRIVRIVATGSEVQRMLAEPITRKRAPAVTIDAKFSIPFAIGAALIDDQVTLDSFDPHRLRQPERLALAAKVEFVVRPDWGRDRAASGVLEIHLDDGRILTETVDIAAGHPRHPLDDSALRAKFIDCAGRAARPLRRDAADAAADMVMALEKLGNTTDLMQVLNCYVS